MGSNQLQTDREKHLAFWDSKKFIPSSVDRDGNHIKQGRSSCSVSPTKQLIFLFPFQFRLDFDGGDGVERIEEEITEETITTTTTTKRKKKKRRAVSSSRAQVTP